MPKEPGAIKDWHAHIYYTPETRDRAERLRGWIGERFPNAVLGRWHDRNVGPHTSPMYQIAFTTDLFPALVPWLMLNRQGLSVLVHPNTDNPHDDHLVHALWLGPPLAIDGSRLIKSLRDTGEPIEVITPNTSPMIDPI